MKSRLFVMLVTASCQLLASVIRPALASEHTLDRDFHHLRIDGAREWAEFPEAPESAALKVRFSAEANAQEYALRLRQQDVKQLWRVSLNDTELGRLEQDEADMVIALPVPMGAIVSGENRLRIEQDQGSRSQPDDVRVGEIILEPRCLDEMLSAASV